MDDACTPAVVTAASHQMPLAWHDGMGHSSSNEWKTIGCEHIDISTSPGHDWQVPACAPQVWSHRTMSPIARTMHGSTARGIRWCSEANGGYRDGNRRPVPRWYMASCMCNHPIASWKRFRRSHRVTGTTTISFIDAMNRMVLVAHGNFDHGRFRKQMTVER